MTTPTLTQAPCQCGDRAATECPGEWEPGCDLGANEAHVRVAPTAAEDALAAALAAPVEKAAPSATLYAEARECPDCGHIGINDDNGTSACTHCDWSGPSPAEDHCPGCGRDGTMTSACPECGHRTTLLAEAHLPIPAQQAAPSAGEWSGERVATLLAQRDAPPKDGAALHAWAMQLVRDVAAQQAAQPVAQEPVAWRQLTYATPMDLWRAFRAGTKFRLHYHGQKVYDITRMEPRDRVIYVSPPRFPVKVFPNGQSAEGDNGAIWLEELTAAPSPVVLVPLTHEQIVMEGLMMVPTNRLGSCADAFEEGVRFAERAHGIKAEKDGAHG